MRRSSIYFLFVIIFVCWLSACNRAGTIHSTPQPDPVIPNEPTMMETVNPVFEKRLTITPTMALTTLPTSTLTATPTPTSIVPPTTLPTITPTFNVAKIVTRTPANPEMCPLAAQVPLPNIPIRDRDNYIDQAVSLRQPLQDYLSEGGSLPFLIEALQERDWLELEGDYLVQDLTGDQIPEIVLGKSAALIYGCSEGQYKLLLALDPSIFYGGPHLEDVIDMNLDGIPELITHKEWYASGGPDSYYQILEWDGNTFRNIVQQSDREIDSKTISIIVNGVIVTTNFTGSSLIDIDKNGTIELVIRGGIPPIGTESYYTFGPWREETYTVMWNGQEFVFDHMDLTVPLYRFQAIQDGDRDTITGKYDHALSHYQDAIFSDGLEWWSNERREYERIIGYGWNTDPNSMVTPTPIADPAEYYNLVAYARFRILLLHTVRGFLPEAEIVYDTLLAKFPQGQTGHAFAEMSTEFWDEYQVSENIGQACSKAIAYATIHPSDILAYLGNGDYAIMYYGGQSLTYEPEDICPFK